MKIEKIKLVLPKKPGILAKSEYFNSVILILLQENKDGLYFIFQKRSKNIRQGGEVSFPGGALHDEDDNDLLKAALRETEEEMGIPSNRIKVLGQMDTLVSLMGTTVDAFVGITDMSLEEMRANPDEVEKIFTVPLAFFEEVKVKKYSAWLELSSFMPKKNGEKKCLLPAKELNLPKRYWEKWGGLSLPVLYYPGTEEPIWGITARFIYDFIQRLSE